MTNYVIARVLAVIPTVLLLLLFVVVLIRLLPGNAVDIMLSEQVGGEQLAREDLEARLGLDKSLLEEFVTYSASVATGDFGKSVWSREEVRSIVSSKIWVTLELSVLSLVIGAAFGIAVGVVSAVFQNSPADYGLRSLSIVGLSIPNFALATMVVVLPTIWWGWSPPLIYTPISDGVWPHFSQFIAPALILGLGLSATLMRLTRATMLEVLRQDYVRTARSKGLSGRIVIVRHSLRNALIPVVSLLGLQVAFLLSGAVLVESVFGIPGLGRELVSSLGTRDYPVIQGITVVSGLWVIVTNLIVDFSYGYLDPRIRVG